MGAVKHHGLASSGYWKDRSPLGKSFLLLTAAVCYLQFVFFLFINEIIVLRFWAGEDRAPESREAQPALRDDWGDGLDEVHVPGGGDAATIQRKGNVP